MSEPGHDESTRADADLWELAGSSPAAFGALFERRARAIYNFCFRCTADWALAEDLTSATFLHAWRRRDEVRFFGTSALPFLYGVAANVIRNHRRGSGRERRAVARLEARWTDAPDHADEVAGRVDDQRRMRRVLERISDLSADEREAFVLVDWQGLSYEATAVALDVPIGTVRSRLSRARRRLRGAPAPEPRGAQAPELRGGSAPELRDDPGAGSRALAAAAPDPIAGGTPHSSSRKGGHE
jgi:RNA polymerase sigma-70 factor (ECF subfamily)